MCVYLNSGEMLRLWIFCVVVAASCLVVRSQTCPPHHFLATFTAGIDQSIDDPQVTLDDPDFTYFKSELQLRERAIQHVTEDAIEFFNSTFGLDFSTLAPNEKNERFFENAKMSPFTLSRSVDYFVTLNNWIASGRTRSTCYRIRDGGFSVSFSGEQNLHGSYGGAVGRTVGLRDVLGYGFYKIEACEQSPVVIQYQCITPLSPGPDGAVVINCDLYNRVLGYGKALGVSMITFDPDGLSRFRFTARSVFTFPSQ